MKIYFRVSLVVAIVFFAGTSFFSKESRAAEKVSQEGAEYVGMDTCEGCHEEITAKFKRSTHARISISKGDVKAQDCEMCHGPGSKHADEGGGIDVAITNPRKDPSACFRCHSDKEMEFRLPSHHPVLEGKMSCADCHDAHGDDVTAWSKTSSEGVNEVCSKCHKEQRGPFVWEHEAVREGCPTCHAVHGSINDKMLVARDNNLCLNCHTQSNFPYIGGRVHQGHYKNLPCWSCHGVLPTDHMNKGACYSAGCHTAVHGSNFDDHLQY